MKLLKSMTTSYELSLRLKELGAVQKLGEYYWVLTDEGEAYCYHHSDSTCNTSNGYTILCRAFTLGELVREIKGINVLHLSDRDAWWAFRNIDAWGKSELDYNNKYTTPEEAAGELYYEILKSKL